MATVTIKAVEGARSFAKVRRVPSHHDPRVDRYIAGAAAFARPILKHLRALVHAVCPQAEETMKWSFPHFLSGGKILCSMAAFKAHCAFGFWHRGMEEVIAADGAKPDDARGSLDRITALAELPSDAMLIGYIKHAAELNESGVPGRPRPARKKKSRELPAPADLAAALQKNRTAGATFAKFSPSRRTEYIEWLTEAKRDATRQKRLATTIEWLSAGRPRYWKYQKC